MAAYLAERAEARKLATVQASAAAIAAVARSARDGRTRRRRPWWPTRCAASRASTSTAPEAAPRQAAALDYATALDLMRAASRPQRRGRGRETAAAAAARGRRDAAIVALAFCAGLRRSEIAALVWGDITPTARAGQLRVRVRASKANADGSPRGPAAARRPLRPRRRRRCARLTESAAAERVVPLGPHQVNRRMQVLAAALGLEGVSSHSGRRGLASASSSAAAPRPPPSRLAGGWRSAAMVARYASAIEVEDGAVARLFGGEADRRSRSRGRCA